MSDMRSLLKAEQISVLLVMQDWRDHVIACVADGGYTPYESPPVTQETASVLLSMLRRLFDRRRWAGTLSMIERDGLGVIRVETAFEPRP